MTLQEKNPLSYIKTVANTVNNEFIIIITDFKLE